jgi:pullulanase
MKIKIIFLIVFIMNCPLNSQQIKQADADTISREKSFAKLISDKALGCTITSKGTTFRLFAPRAVNVTLVIFEEYDDTSGEEIPMVRDSIGVWEYLSLGMLYGKYYGYRIDGPSGPGEMFDPNIIVGDPYSKAVITKNDYHHSAKTLILNTKYDWGNDTYVIPQNHNKLIIYEAHIRDLTVHRSSGVRARGTYLGLTEKGKAGGLSYLKDLGVNAIEFLPIHEFANIEIPYRDSTALTSEGEVNTWNPYERNHWGYMSSYFFAPESYYSSNGTIARGDYNGVAGKAVHEFKDLVKTLHKEGIAVILDVVYNHVSNYDYNPFKYIDKFYYFHTDSSGKFIKTSGCGNDFYTERPMARKLIIESIKYWMKEYHIDGFRFDLATTIDSQTCVQILAEAKKINPNVILIAEAWGGGKYDPPGFSDIGWASWNDQIRNGVKGQNPADGLGFIFGKFQGNKTKKSFQSYLTGTLRKDGGMYVRKEHSINYLESHDDNTLSDFIRLATGSIKPDTRISDLAEHVRLPKNQLMLNKLAALYLFSAQGPIMIHEGQEFARSKVIAPTSAPDPLVGTIDHNSYNKDNETNYLNYGHRAINNELYNYYKGLIQIRNRYPLLCDAPRGAIEFLETKNDFHIAMRVKEPAGKDAAINDFLVILNGDPADTLSLPLPAGKWQILADAKSISVKNPKPIMGKKVAVPPTSGMILKKTIPPDSAKKRQEGKRDR